jgi:hypothetical protein
MSPWPKNSHVFGLDLEKLGFVVSKWKHDVPLSWRCFSAFKKGEFSKNSAVLHLKKTGPFWGRLGRGSCALVGWWGWSKKFRQVFVTTRGRVFCVLGTNWPKIE